MMSVSNMKTAMSRFNLGKSMLDRSIAPGLKMQVIGDNLDNVPENWNWNSHILSDKGQNNCWVKTAQSLTDRLREANDTRVVIPLPSNLEDAAIRFTQNELTQIQNEIEHVRRARAKSDKFIKRQKVEAGIKTYKYYVWKDIIEPRITTTYEGGRIVHTAKEESSVTFIGFDYDVYFSMVELDRMNLSSSLQKHSESLMQGTITEVTNSAAKYQEWMIHRGTDVPNIIDTSVKGVFNATGVIDPGALGAGSDDDLTAYGDISTSAMKMATLLALEDGGYYADQKYLLLMTPGVYAQMIMNINTSADLLPNDLKLIIESGLFSEIVVDPFLIDDTETTTTGAMAVVANDEKNVVLEPRPLGYYEYPITDFGRRGKILCEFGVMMQHPNAIVYANALTTNVIS